MNRRLPRRAAWWLLAALLLGVAVGWHTLTGRPAEAEPPRFARPLLRVSPDAAGVTFTLSAVPGDRLPDGVPVRLVLSTPAGPLQELASTRFGRTDLKVPYVRAGLTGYDLTLAGHRYRGSWWRNPGPAVTPLRLKVGARAVRVVGDPPPALVIHPQDAQGNVSNLPVLVRVQQPSVQAQPGTLWTRQVAVRHLLAWAFLPVGPRTGTLQVTASVGDAHGERAEVDLLPGPAAQARFRAPLGRAPASGRDGWQLELAAVRDRLDNPVLDGSSVTLLGQGTEHFSVTRQTVGGALRLSLPAAPEPGQYSLTAQTGGYRSAALALTSLTPVEPDPFPVLVAGKTVQVGPVLTPLGALPDNGTAVHLRILDAGGELLYAAQGVLSDGSTRFSLPDLASGQRTVEAEVGGQRSTVPLNVP
ncbi:hypothetical protein [Deinococcus sp.]|uniref:hypothetical protein n=1 Tax=Deinococcus sp. TaxID=47478 RepID=UPI003CC5719E